VLKTAKPEAPTWALMAGRGLLNLAFGVLVAFRLKGVVVTTPERFDSWLPAILPRTMQKTLEDTLPALLLSLKVAAEKDARRRRLPFPWGHPGLAGISS
jgi:hypothetical protein